MLLAPFVLMRMPPRLLETTVSLMLAWPALTMSIPFCVKPKMWQF